MKKVAKRAPAKKTGARTPQKKKIKKRSKQKSFILTVLKMLILCTVVLVMACAGIFGGAIIAYIRDSQPIRDDDLLLKTGLTTFIYDANNQEIHKLTGKENKDREPVSFKEAPDDLKDAIVAIEDERFYEHSGVDLRRMISAALSALVSFGNPEHGASTITQQVVRNVTGKTERTLSRKVQEQWNAIQLEKRYSKEQILELYMNVIFMGENCYGVQSASKRYFGKDVRDLSLAECALLAGITNSPNRLYNLKTEAGRANAITRQKVILGKMLELGMISEEEYQKALKEKLVFREHDETAWTPGTQSYYVDLVINDVAEALAEEKGLALDEARRRIYNNGYKIYTCQDINIQKAVDEVYQDEKYFAIANPEAKKENTRPQAAMAVIDPYTGAIKAIVGGSGKKEGNMTLNRAVQAQRQPGSSIKPIAVYGPALDLKLITPATIIDNIPVYMEVNHPEKRYPENFDEQYQGLTSIRDGVRSSVNVVAARVWKEILGRDNSVDYLKKVGIDRSAEISDTSVAVAMGGLKNGVSALEMAAAYAPFANGGLYYKPMTFTKVLDSEGKVLLEREPEYHPVYSEQSAFLMTHILTEVTSRQGGTAYPRGIIKNAGGKVILTAGKTGTTSENRDKWFVGYSPYYVVSSWFGYDNNYVLTGNERSQALILWHDVMEKLHKDLEPREFPIPTGLVKKKVCIYSGKTPSELCVKDPRGSAVREEYFIKGTEPNETDPCDVHVEVTVCRDSKDLWGRNLLAGPNCPEASRMSKVHIQRPEPYTAKYPGEPLPLDFKLYELPLGEYCNVH